MGRPTYNELDAAYRQALREIVQMRQRSEVLERRLLAESARHRQAAQAIDLSIEELKREEQQHEAGRAMDRAAQEGKPPIDLSRITRA